MNRTYHVTIQIKGLSRSGSESLNPVPNSQRKRYSSLEDSVDIADWKFSTYFYPSPLEGFSKSTPVTGTNSRTVALISKMSGNVLQGIASDGKDSKGRFYLYVQSADSFSYF